MSRKLRIGLFQDAFFPVVDGVVEVVDHYARELSEIADMTVFVPRTPGRPFDDSTLPYRVVRCNSLPVPVLDYDLPAPDLDITFLRELEKTELDLVHIHSPFSLGKIGVRYAKKHHIPAVATFHTQFRRDFERALKNYDISVALARGVIQPYRQCEECWAVNSAMEKLLHLEYAYKGASRVMRNATDMQPIADEEEARRMVEERFDIRPEEKVFLYVGRLNQLKNVFMIADAVRILKEKADFPFCMVFAGDGQDEKRLHERVYKHGIEREVLFTGKIDDRDLLAALYARAELFLFPSLYDASSLVQVEAASQGTPGIFVRGAATADTVKDHVNAFLIDNDEHSLAEMALSVIHDPALLRTVSENAKRDLYLKWPDVTKEAYHNYIRVIEEYKKGKR